MTLEEFKKLPIKKAKVINEKYSRARWKFFKGKGCITGVESLKFRDDFLKNLK